MRTLSPGHGGTEVLNHDEQQDGPGRHAVAGLPSGPGETSPLSGQNSRLGVPPGGGWPCPAVPAVTV